MPQSNNQYHHLFPPNTSSTEPFTSPKSGRNAFNTPPRDRNAHKNKLLGQICQIQNEEMALSKQRESLGITAEDGIIITFVGDADFDLKFESLEYSPSGIELLTVKKENGVTKASVFVPEGKIKYFINKVEKYGSEVTKKGNKAKNKDLIEGISEIRKATLKALWNDEPGLFPEPGEIIWWEIWLRVGKNKDEILTSFRNDARHFGLRVNSEVIKFPDRTVLLTEGSHEQVAQSVEMLTSIAELRKAKENPEIFMAMPRTEQIAWTEEALQRITPAHSDRLRICCLDTGVNRGHPLIMPHLTESDLHSYDPAWGIADTQGHGTQMAGLGLYGDLVDFFAGNCPVLIPYKLESVKMYNQNVEHEPHLYGYVTLESVSRVEVSAPHSKRILTMAISTPDFRDRGKPSSWSAMLDSLTSGAEDDIKRLFIVSAGNTVPDFRHNYPANNLTDEIHDPAQAWNALSIGAYTEKTYIDQNEYTGWSPIAPEGDISPSSTTSFTWERQWPNKPDVVFEGGNSAFVPGVNRADYTDSLQLLSTHHRFQERLFTITGDTSAATYLAARFAGHVLAEYPDMWPETVRGLMVHSAEWTPAMLARWNSETDKIKYKNLLRYCGYGVPNLNNALWSVSSCLTLIVEDVISPFILEGSQCKTKNMHIHKIPWPVEELELLGETETEVEMRVTLSYYIEPNPARRGWGKKYRYASHGLRFDVITPEETIDQFRTRINKAAREENERSTTSSDSIRWDLGFNLRHRGSLHSDRWRGTAVALAQRKYIAIFPVSGWWKERYKLGKWNREARYSLIVTIKTPETSVDIYTPVANQIAITI